MYSFQLGIFIQDADKGGFWDRENGELIHTMLQLPKDSEFRRRVNTTNAITSGPDWQQNQGFTDFTLKGSVDLQNKETRKIFRESNFIINGSVEKNIMYFFALDFPFQPSNYFSNNIY